MVDVCIIGLGPVGAALANLLGMAGRRVLVLEREAAAYHLPRAVHFDEEVMRLFETMGLAEAIVQHTHVSPGMRFVDAEGRVLLEWPRPAGLGKMGWNSSYRFHQPDLERALRAGLARFAGVQVVNGAEVVGLVQDDGGVDVTYRSDQVASVRARYVVGCDGARSFVRGVIGEAPEALGFRERWLVIDLILRRPMPELGDWSVQFCDPARSATYVRGTGMRRRWEIRLHADEAPDAGLVWALLARWIGPEDAELERFAVYWFASVLAHPWRDRRLLIAGDAAHQTPPFLGQGMCTGMRDVANLAWKLDRVLGGFEPAELLDSYESERADHARAYIALAVQLGGLINTTAAEAALPKAGPARMSSIQPALGPGLAVGWDGLGRLVAPQPMLSDGRRLDAVVGYRFALLMRPDITLAEAHARHLAASDIVLVADGALLGWLHEAGCIAVALRPDRYILGAARDDGELARLLDQISRPIAAKGAGRECSASSADPSALSACTTPEHDDR